ncbi:SubName: Full=Related to Sel-1 homolog {ECO:0000313/EMBL:CCA68700.1} [Serendipita indica DSM 11827]|nr:SubName: Full=Related to Sel-1 homolog {ECO:0000313/EMBL:CCA68700.1} [Serendipita indica DSM 11827]
MRRKHSTHQRRATWLAFAVVALAACTPVVQAAYDNKHHAGDVSGKEESSDQRQAEPPAISSTNGDEQYRKALELLASLPSARTLQKAAAETNRPKSLLASLFPNHEGPIATAVRILGRIEQELSFLPVRVFKSFNFKRPNPNIREKASSQAAKALALLEEASEKGNLEATYTLGMSSLFPPPGAAPNATRALLAFDKHASITGNSTSQAVLGFIHSTGLQGVVPIDQAQALLYYTFAALGGDQHAEMALGYRYFMGIGVSEDCLQALDWYESAAEKSLLHFQSGPPGGRTLPPTPLKLTDMAGGVFGYGASTASTGLMANRPIIKAAQALKTGERWDEVIEYWRFHADRGDIEAAYRLGKIYYHGGMYVTPGGISAGVEGIATVQKDFVQSRSYFFKVARKVWPRDNPANVNQFKATDVDPTDMYFAILSAHFIGRMHLRGEGIRQDIKIAKMWFERGALEGDKESLNALGIIYRDGLLDGKEKNDKAIVYFSRAAAQDLPEALVNMGKIYYRNGNMVMAKNYFDNAIRYGSQFEAFYYAATIHANMARNNPHNTPACTTAVSFFKQVAERGCWKNNVIAEAEKYWNSPDPSLREGAIVRWQIAADRGVEVAQNNLAYVLEELAKSQKRTIHSGSGLSKEYNHTAQDAIMYWTRSAAQGDVDAMVKLGDLHYHGIGVDEPPALRHEKAAGYYHAAADSYSTIAMWNIGWMYENGIGAPQDFHLAKRYYDMALDYNHSAQFPIVLSLIKLHLRSLWYILRGGTQPSLILWGDDAENEGWWPKLWRSSNAEPATDRQKVVDVDDEDPIQRARNIRDAAVGIGDEEDPGDDYFDGMTRRRHGAGGGGAGREGEGDNAEFEEFEDDWELVVLALLAMGIGGLIILRRYYEQRRQEALERLERERQQQQQQQQQGGTMDHEQQPGQHHPPAPAPEHRLNEPLQNMGLFM